MTGPVHDRAQLGAYALGALDPAEARVVQGHLAGCLDCQREVSELMTIRRALDQVPPEAFVDGPPADGDLLLQRTLRQVRAETPEPRRSRTGLVVAAAAVAVAVALGGGVLLGRQTAPTQQAAPPPTTATSTPSNASLASATDPSTGTTMDVALEPKKGWVWVHAQITGLPENEPCELVVVTRDGKEILAGSWLVSADGAKNGTRLEGTALTAPDDVAKVEIRTTSGRTMVSVPV
jgi:hypothetical protein